MMRTVVLGVLILIMMSAVMFITTDSVFGTHLVPELAPAEEKDVFSINTELIDESTILVTGHAPRAAMEPVQIKVTAPNGNLVSIDQLTVGSDFNYKTTIKTSPELWTVNGAYVIAAYQGPTGLIQNIVSTKVTVVDGILADFKMDFQTDGGYVRYIEADPDSNSLIISISTEVYAEVFEVFPAGGEGEGALTIELPRKIIDAKILDTHLDGQFVVLVDGVETAYEESIASSIRALTIPFPPGTEEIKIMGSYVDPRYAIEIGGIPVVVGCSASEISAKSTLGGVHCISYTITGGTVTSGTLDIVAISLIVKVNALDDGMITLDIPRSVLDADGDFFALVDDEEWDIDLDEKFLSTRKLTISFPSGTEVIEVIGTSIIPEFGTIAVITLGVVIASIITVSARTKLRILPKC